MKPPQPRRYTLGYVPNGGKTQPSPQLKISGKWLEELGFMPRQSVTIKVDKNKLIIELENQF
ncbi:type I toxin-antitoxin system SymE family toxin [Budviciaceae bacterium CWB-B4]|uniref:Type I toxin-antitoxin system SymE family toxin n=1 Tax=Limnobaculum xujianqingii TaxID=2738837 RepID=A0A9D7AIZ1_9GAMM|nr:SymE family type I addiction module toxin [Limnobaculum xujianqingii]MBK5073449.1 type I toxin-antitoxin system SymE family toxin [Limnobaculum xujianqingii]MBK5176820.1 type I toxin-antitoxin system SymE family toxin [Limnobaculum xujianqingii]